MDAVVNLKSNYREFQRVISEKGIESLVHFTSFPNVTAIVGDKRILPRNQLHNLSYEWKELVTVNAEKRFDDPGYLNTSIMHPNIWLLETFRDKWKKKIYPFCIIGIDSAYIFEEKTKFSISNATYPSSKNFGINGDLNTFSTMFKEEIPGKPGTSNVKRSPLLKPYYTTCPQAEVLIKAEIPYSDIRFIACQNKFEHDLLASAFDVLELSTEKLCVQPTLFEPVYGR